MRMIPAPAALTTALALLVVPPVQAASVMTGMTSISRVSPGVLSGAPQDSLAGTGSTVLLNSAGFINGSQVFSDAVNIPAAGTLTVKLAGISWLDALQSLNCFVTAPGGGIIGNAQNGDLDSVPVQPGTYEVDWYAKAGAPLFLGAYSLSASFQPTAPPPPPVPLPPGLLLLASGLFALMLGLRRPRLSPAVGA